MAAIITDDFRKNNIENFVTDVSNSPALGGRNYYVGIGKTDPYPNQGASLSITEASSNFVPPPPNGSILEKDDVKRNLMTLIKIGENDVRRLIPQVEYRVGATYKVYDITDPTCFDKDADGTLPCYALYTDGDGLTKLYICLNNKASDGTVQPTTSVIPTMPNPASGSLFPFGVQQNTTTDNYIWTYVDYLNTDDTNNLFRDSQTFQTLTADADVDTKVNAVAIAPHTGVIDGRSRATRASAGLVYGFNILDGGNTLLANTDLTGRIVGERLDGNPVDENNTITLTTDANGAISNISWTLANAIDLGVGRVDTIDSNNVSITGLADNPDNTVGNKGVLRASVVIDDASYTAKVSETNFVKPNIQPLIAPAYGFGHAPLEDLPSYYCGISADFEGTVGNNSPAPGNVFIGEALVGVKFRQLSILRDSDSPYGVVRGAEDDSPGVAGGGLTNIYPDPALAADKAVNCLPYFQISTNDTDTISEVPSGITSLGGDGAYIEAGTTDANEGEPARAWLDQVSAYSSVYPQDGNPNKSGNQTGGYRVYYHQNSDKRINKIPFPDATSAGVEILIKDSTGNTQGTIKYTDKKNGEYLRPNGEVMFVENRLPIQRNIQQTEEVRLILQF